MWVIIDLFYNWVIDNYIGHIVSNKGLKLDPRKTETIKNMSTPKNREELQISRHDHIFEQVYSKSFADSCATQGASRERCGMALARSPGQKFQNIKTTHKWNSGIEILWPNKASQNLSGCKLKRNGSSVVTRRTSSSICIKIAYQNYAQIEKEMLAIVFGCTHFHEYIYGMPHVEVETDHKPLKMILKKPLHQAPTRLQKWLWLCRNTLLMSSIILVKSWW